MSSPSGKGGRISRRKKMDEKCTWCAEGVGKSRKVEPSHLWGTGGEEPGQPHLKKCRQPLPCLFQAYLPVLSANWPTAQFSIKLIFKFFSGVKRIFLMQLVIESHPFDRKMFLNSYFLS